MFAGIIETIGTVLEIEVDRGNRVYWITADIVNELKVDQSLAHDGVCLTVEEILLPPAKRGGSPVPAPGIYRVSAIAETLTKTALSEWRSGRVVNLERSLAVGDRIDGHFVQGHVDTTGELVEIRDLAGSRELVVSFPGDYEVLVVAKGSICVNGVSLTVVASRPEDHLFSVHIIPYTIEQTNLKDLRPGSRVNLEFDVLGKYIQKMLAARL